MTRKELEDKQALVRDLPLIMDRAGRVGLFRTMQKLHLAVREAGWELADQLMASDDE